MSQMEEVRTASPRGSGSRNKSPTSKSSPKSPAPTRPAPKRPSNPSSPTSGDTPRNSYSSKSEKEKEREKEKDKSPPSRNSRYSCFCLDIGIKGQTYDEPKKIASPQASDEDEDMEVKPDRGEFKKMKQFSIERYYKIFANCTDLTLPLFKIIASYFFVDYRWLVNLEKEGILANKYTWITGTKRGRKLYIHCGLSMPEGLNLNRAFLYWVIPNKPAVKKKRRTIQLKGIEGISTGKSTLTFNRGQAVDSDGNRCFSLTFLYLHNLPGTKIQRTFLRSLDFEVQSKKIRDQLALFLQNFFWIFRDGTSV